MTNKYHKPSLCRKMCSKKYSQPTAIAYCYQQCIKHMNITDIILELYKT